MNDGWQIGRSSSVCLSVCLRVCVCVCVRSRIKGGPQLIRVLYWDLPWSAMLKLGDGNWKSRSNNWVGLEKVHTRSPMFHATMKWWWQSPTFYKSNNEMKHLTMAADSTWMKDAGSGCKVASYKVQSLDLLHHSLFTNSNKLCKNVF
jgi:hypothetical protein